MPTNPNMVAIETVTVPSGGAAEIEFTSIPATYTDLVLKISARSDGSGGYTFQNMLLKINGATTNGSTRWVKGNGSTASSASDTPFYTEALNYPLSTSNTFSSMEFYFPNYLSSNYKSVSLDVVAENNATLAQTVLQAGLWSNTNTITSLSVYPNVGNFVQYSSATLYGVTSAAVAAYATGGNITMDENYFYHTFLASGTFTPTQALTADYLVVAGGGGGSDYGGGGAGGMRCTVDNTGGGGTLESSLSLTAQAYTVTVGGGGTGADIGTAGSNSVFSTITSTGGGEGAYNAPPIQIDGGPGGSGGGGRWTGGVGGTRTASPVQGNNGGDGGTVVTDNPAGGGGGAGQVGGNGVSAVGGGAGGNGLATSISGSSITYAGGGGGGVAISSPGPVGGAGGTGGGGDGGINGSGNTAGSTNTGGGGGGSGTTSGTGSNGGSGIVIVRYAR